MEAAGLGGAPGPRGWSGAQERPGCELLGFPTSRQELRVGGMRLPETETVQVEKEQPKCWR